MTVQEKLAYVERERLAHEGAKLDPEFEKAMAEEGIAKDASAWPEY